MSFANEKINLAVSLRVRYDLPPFFGVKFYRSLLFIKGDFFYAISFVKDRAVRL